MVLSLAHAKGRDEAWLMAAQEAMIHPSIQSGHYCSFVCSLLSMYAMTSTFEKFLQGLMGESVVQGINEKPQIIQEYESGKAIPNPQVLSKLSRILGVQLSAKGKKPK